MFGIFRRDPIATLEKELAKKLEAAMHAQRSGKIPQYATLMAEAEIIAERIDALKASLEDANQ